MLWPGKNNLVGLDIGTRHIKAAEIRKTKKGYFLKSLGMVENLAGAAMENSPSNPKAVVSSIQTLFNRYKIKAKNTAVAIGGNKVIVQLIRVSADSPDKLREAFITEAEQRIPFDIDSVDIDYHVLPDNGKPSSQTLVLLTAAQKTIVDRHARLLTAARLRPCVLNVDIFALINIVAFNYNLGDQNAVLIDIGASKISLCILKNGAPVFIRTVTSGCNQINIEIARRNSCTLQEAEQIKELWPTGGAAKTELDRIESDTAAQWCAEIANALGFYTSTHGDVVIDRFYLSGGGANIASFRKILTDRTATEAVMVNPFNRVHVDSGRFDVAHLKHIGPQSTICLGLALREVDA
jgi:type IV pilus assembly protein PilM